MAALASKPSGSEANTASVNAVNFPEDILDTNKEAETDIFHFYKSSKCFRTSPIG